MKYRFIFTILVVVALLLGAINVMAQEGEAPARTGLRPDAPTYGVRGPHPVGTMDMVLDNEERPLPVTIWYPALNPDGLEEIYTYPANYPPVFPPLEVYGHALFEAAPDTANGPYPLVVWSHGFTSFRTMNVFWTEHLASYGFVVIAPDHLGRSASEIANEPDTFWPMYYESPVDIQLVVDFAEAITNEGLMAGIIDMEHIAASGHSSGGFTVMQAAGGSLDMNVLAECEVKPSFDCPNAAGQEDNIAQMYGMAALPEDGIIPAIVENRLDAVVAFAPDQMLFGANGLTNVTVPTLYMAGTNDLLVPFSDIETGFNSLGSDTAYMVVFGEGGHGLFQDTCETFPAMAAFGFYDLCAEKVWDKLRAHDLVNHYATAFMLWQLKGDEDAAAVFGDEPQTFPGVEVVEG